MVRTRADNTARKAVAAKAPRKVLGASSSGASSSIAGLASPAGKYAGGNAACLRPTPDWQKGIGSFLQKNTTKVTDKENEEPIDVEVGESSSATKEVGGSSTATKESDESETSPKKSSSETPVKAKKNGLIESDSDED